MECRRRRGRGPTRTELQSLGAWLLALATIGGFLLGALALHLLWLAIPLLVVALLGAFQDRFRRVLRAMGDYERLTQHSQVLEQQLAKCQDDVRTLEHQATKALENGRLTGRAEVEGAIHSALVRNIPKLVGMNVAEDEVVLIATWRADPHLVVGTRFLVLAETTRQIRGEVAVTLVDQRAGLVFLTAVGQDYDAYWRGLRGQAVVDPGPPPNVCLERLATDLFQSPDAHGGAPASG